LKYGSFERWKLPKFNLFLKKFSVGYKLYKCVFFGETGIREHIIENGCYLFLSNMNRQAVDLKRISMKKSN